MNKEKILLFNINIFKADQIRRICSGLNIEVKNVPQSDFGKTIAQLAGSSQTIGQKSKMQNVQQQNDLFTGEMLVFCWLTPDKMDKFLAEYKNNMIQPVELKAALTPFNGAWMPARLHAQLSREHSIVG